MSFGWRADGPRLHQPGGGVDFITIDGGEGGTGAGPLVFTDHVALPFKVGFSRVLKIFTEHGLHQRILFIGSGKLGFPEAAVFAFALGCDAISVGREAMMAIGGIQGSGVTRITALRASRPINGYGRGFGLPSPADCDDVRRLMAVPL